MSSENMMKRLKYVEHIEEWCKSGLVNIVGDAVEQISSH